jgi:hypothetical protein
LFSSYQEVYTAKLVEEGGEGAYVATVRLAESAGGGGGDNSAGGPSFYIGEVKSDSGRNTNLFRLVGPSRYIYGIFLYRIFV